MQKGHAHSAGSVPLRISRGLLRSAEREGVVMVVVALSRLSHWRGQRSWMVKKQQMDMTPTVRTDGPVRCVGSDW